MKIRQRQYTHAKNPVEKLPTKQENEQPTGTGTSSTRHTPEPAEHEQGDASSRPKLTDAPAKEVREQHLGRPRTEREQP
jgi:hypothetical protein